jgi:methylenetetrahydrofolate--tRNA-(uracil-5-)-methyltransferase
MSELTIVGGGLAGCEAAWQAARRGLKVKLYEMRPYKTTGAHKTGLLAELVCSNSLRSKEPETASGLLKMEMQMAGSLIMEAAAATTVPAGSALAVDRHLFSEYITRKITEHPLIDVIRDEVRSIPEGKSIISSGPLTSESLSESLKQLLGGDYLYFYDAIAPIVDADSIDYSKLFRGSRYNKGGNDYLNCPMNRDEYERFYESLIKADLVTPKSFEDSKVFEGCMPVEVLARRGFKTLRFGPMKPVGLVDPRTGDMPFAVVQLRTENRYNSAYNIVGFQTRLRWPEQKRVFRLIPGLEGAEFLRYGSIHRNTYINGPKFLNPDLSLVPRPGIYIAGQLAGVEGYIESTAMGLIAGINASRAIKGLNHVSPPRESAHGSLLSYITGASPDGFQPSNINFGLFPSYNIKTRNRRERRRLIVEKALAAWKEHLTRLET